MRKLNIRYHNPNTAEETLKHITKIFTEASKVKFENTLRENAVQVRAENKKELSPSI